MKKAFVPYLTAGDPSLEMTRALAHMLAAEGADVLELGVPFTDPIADGPVNQRAGQRALDRGVTPGDVVQLVQDLRSDGFTLPIVLFTYSNPLLQLDDLGGVSMVLVTDLPPEEAGSHIARCRAAGIDTVFLAAPTTPLSRMQTIADHSTGFLYYVSSKGVTGARTELPADLEGQITKLREFTDLPIYVGFGIASRSTAARVCAIADGYVVGSAIGRVIEQAADDGADVVEAVRAFVRSIDPR
jgi:tryptophan synthase alpha chain